jgi:hypothetical protein
VRDRWVFFCNFGESSVVILGFNIDCQNKAVLKISTSMYSISEELVNHL